MTRFATLWFGLVLAVHAVPAEAPPHYTVQLDVYVTDERALCKQAWDIALPDHGPRIAELLTMKDGQYNAVRCLSTVMQKVRLSGAESRGVYVREVQ
jgi:hypothetical protein